MALRSCGRGLGLPLGAEDEVTAGETLELELAAVVEAEAVAIPGARRLSHLVGDQDLAPSCLGCDPGGEDHVLAEEVALLGDHLAGVEAHPNAESLSRTLPLALRERALHVDGAFEGLAGIGEGEHEPVALALHLV